MTQDPTFNRRKYPRLLTESLVSIARLDSSDALAHAVDLSHSGVRFECVGLDVEVGDVLKLALTFGERTTTVLGQLVRVTELDPFTKEVALVFLKMDDATRLELEEHLEGGELLGTEDRRGEPRSEAGDDRREHGRVAVGSVASVTRANLVDMVVQARDLSQGGMCFTVEGLDLELGDISSPEA
jgi:hypothetical protein